MTVISSPQGYVVHAGRDQVAGPFATQAEAWRWVDRHEGQPVSASEKRGAYSWDRNVHARYEQ